MIELIGAWLMAFALSLAINSEDYLIWKPIGKKKTISIYYPSWEPFLVSTIFTIGYYLWK